MNRFNAMLAGTFLSATLLAASAAQAMEIRQFDEMAVPDQGNYVGLLIAGAEQVLNGEGRSDEAAKVVQLFTTTAPGDAHTKGNVEFQMNLALAREADVKRLANDPNAHRLAVEDAMLVTLKKNNIAMPQEFIRDFRGINSNFRPKLPVQN